MKYFLWLIIAGVYTTGFAQDSSWVFAPNHPIAPAAQPEANDTLIAHLKFSKLELELLQRIDINPDSLLTQMHQLNSTSQENVFIYDTSHRLIGNVITTRFQIVIQFWKFEETNFTRRGTYVFGAHSQTQNFEHFFEYVAKYKR